jgi:ABC-type sugar transport system ATPase subunit
MTSLLRRRTRTVPIDAPAPVISMVDVGMTYPNGKVALTDVNVSIPRGDFVFLVGPSGAGKSTFIRLLIREQLPTHGQVRVAGRDLLRMRRSQVPALRRRIGIVFQDFRLLPNKTVWENVAFALEVTGAPGSTTTLTTCRPSYPAASSSAWRSRVPWSTTRRSSSPTSRPATSTRSRAGRSSSSSSRSTSWAPRC